MMASRYPRPSPAWREQLGLLRDLFDLTYPQAADLLDHFGDADSAFEELARQ